MRYNTQAQFDALVINRLHAATMDLRQSGQFNFAALKTLHDQAFEPSPHLPVEVRDMMRSYYQFCGVKPRPLGRGYKAQTAKQS